MKIYIIILTIIYLGSSCKMGPFSDKKYKANNPKELYNIKLKPISGSSYEFTSENSLTTITTVNDKKLENSVTTSETAIYKISMNNDSDYIFNIVYKKLHLVNEDENNKIDVDTETELNSEEPIAIILGMLKDDTTKVIINSSGKIIQISGLSDLADKVIKEFGLSDENSKSIIRKQCEKIIANGIVKNNLNQILMFFPDSMVHTGDTWKVTSVSDNSLGMSVRSIFKLVEIDKNVAIIEAKGKIINDLSANYSSDITEKPLYSSLEGTQTCRIEIEVNTGILLNSEISAEVSGIINEMGMDIPIKMKIFHKIKGKRIF